MIRIPAPFLTENRIEVFTRFDVAYDQALTAAVMAGAIDDDDPNLRLFFKMHRVVDLLKEIRDELEPGR